MSDTIYAFATPDGHSALAVIRLSGPGCGLVISKMIQRPLASRLATVVKLRHPETLETIDEAVSLFFPAPGSFTGDDCLEFHVHGGRAVRQAVLSAISSFPGFRLAEAGEFTRRAYENGKRDLASIEGLADLLEAETEVQRRLALGQIEGVAARKCREWRDLLVRALALLEVTIDFSDEGDVPEAASEEISEIVRALKADLKAQIDGYRGVEIVRDGYRVAIAGPPNVGKSSLINSLARRDVAIVTNIPGTTRDVLEVSIDVAGFLVQFVDTAGFRDTVDEIELIGIEKARGAVKAADLVLWLYSCEDDLSDPPLLFAPIPKMFLRTKSDLNIQSGSIVDEEIAVSNKTQTGMDELLEAIRRRIELKAPLRGGSVVMQQRQVECARAALEALDRASFLLASGQAEVLSEELRTVAGALSRISGEVESDEVLGEIFSRFCIGK